MAEPIEATTAKNKDFAVVDQPTVLVNQGDFLAKYQNTIITIVAAILVGTLGFFGYKYYINEQDAEAQTAMFRSVFYFEADSLDKALKGSNGNLGLEQIAEEYGNTPAGNQAHYYSGVIYLKKGKFNEAIEHLSKVNFGDALVQARALSLLGDAHLELKQYNEAVGNYKKAAGHQPNKFFTPGYLMKLALAQELNNDLSGAINSYNTVITKYGDQGDAADAKKYKAMAEEKSGATK